MDPREQDLWQHFRRGGDFAQGSELLSQYYPQQQVPVETVKTLQNWLTKGIVSQINSGDLIRRNNDTATLSDCNN